MNFNCLYKLTHLARLIVRVSCTYSQKLGAIELLIGCQDRSETACFSTNDYDTERSIVRASQSQHVEVNAVKTESLKIEKKKQDF